MAVTREDVINRIDRAMDIEERCDFDNNNLQAAINYYERLEEKGPVRINQEIADKRQSFESDSLQAAKSEYKRLKAKGPINGEWIIYTFRPVIGWLIVLIKRFFRKMLHGYIPRIVEEENNRAELQNQVLHNLICAMEEMQARLAETVRERERYVAKILEEENARAEMQKQLIQSLLCAMQDMQDSLAEAAEEREQFIAQKLNLEEIKTVESKMAALDEKTMLRIEEVKSALGALNEKAMLRIETVEKQAEKLETTIHRNDEDAEALASFPYDLFEDRFRGTVDDIRERQSIYLEYFKGRENVLDCGCGRGEFLSLLRSQGIPAKGIDMSAEMVSRCQRLGLDVEQADLFTYLERLPDGALDGVFCCQVIEHLTSGQLIRFVKLLRKKVRIGAPLVMETINPRMLPAVSNWFYMDLSHIRPVHPATLSFLLEINGFPYQNQLSLHRDTQNEIPELMIEGAELFNQRITKTNELLFGAQDYAIVAYRQ